MTNNVIVTKVKKDNSIIIIKEEEYGNKISFSYRMDYKN
jgi:hypothetical protein